MNKIRDFKNILDTLLNNAKSQNNADDVKSIRELIYMHNFQKKTLLILKNQKLKNYVENME